MSIHDEEWLGKKVWVWAGVSVGRRAVVGDPGWSGKRNVGLLECLEQLEIIEWIWNKNRQTEVLQWKNVFLGRLKKHSIYSDSFTGSRAFLRWHHREYRPHNLPSSSQTHLLTQIFLWRSSYPRLLTLQDKQRSSLIYVLCPWSLCTLFHKVCQEWSSYILVCLQIRCSFFRAFYL